MWQTSIVCEGIVQYISMELQLTVLAGANQAQYALAVCLQQQQMQSSKMENNFP